MSCTTSSSSPVRLRVSWALHTDHFRSTPIPALLIFIWASFELPGDLSLDRLDHRASLLSLLDHQRRCALARVEATIKAGGSTPTRTNTSSGAGATASLDPCDVYAEKAFRLLHSPAVREAFDLGSEDPRLRDRYGRNKLGQSSSWPGVWSRLAFVSSRFTTGSITDRQPTGTRMKMSSAGSRMIWRRPPTSLSQL